MGAGLTLDQMIKAAISDAWDDEQKEVTASAEKNTEAKPIVKEASVQKVAAEDILQLADRLDEAAEELEKEASPAAKLLAKLGAGKGAVQQMGSETNMNVTFAKKEPKKDAASKKNQPLVVPPTEAGTAPGTNTALKTNMHEDGATLKVTQSDNILKTSSYADVKSKILAKLGQEKTAGEDVSPASISSPKAARNPEEDNSPRQPQQGDRALIRSNGAAIGYTKRQAKGTVKSVLKDVLDEKALSKSTDGKLHQNLANAEAAGVKIAQVREQLKKVAAHGCTCGTKGTCSYCKMQSRMKEGKEKKASVQKAKDRFQDILRKRNTLAESTETQTADTATQV